MQTIKRLVVDSPATYTVRVQGSLDTSWSEYLSSAIISLESEPNEPPVTVITGEFQDQAALAGALNLLYDLGLPLLSVGCIGFEPNRPV